MKDFNKILYDILLKLDLNTDNNKNFLVNTALIKKYFTTLNNSDANLAEFNGYLTNFFNFCFELPLDNMLERAIDFNY